MGGHVWPECRGSAETFDSGVKLVKKLPGGEGVQHWVIECSVEVRRWLLARDKVYIEWNACRAKDYADVVRCFKCQGYGHVGNYCKDKLVCSFCSGEHDSKECNRKDGDHACPACKKFGKVLKHKINDRSCPGHVRALEESVNRTDYGR